MKYRREIDGLRAVAVLPVILFHGGITTFSGGFVGVDVFFVISGYLITIIIHTEIREGRFSILTFYERRARRILPALVFVCLFCLPFAVMWMIPSQQGEFARSLVSVFLFGSNFYFWRANDYFASEAEEAPLLHTWSLAVEEQYYLIFPLVLLLLLRIGPRTTIGLLVLATLGSLALADYASWQYPRANFYLLPTRAWELLCGSLCAFVLWRRGPLRNEWLGAIGLAAIVAAILLFDEATRFPSLYAVIPVLGTALIILFATEGTLVARVLSTKALVAIGLVSYSAYLWHQPLFAFARIRVGEEPVWMMLGLSVLALVLATFSWRFVEQPFRRRAAGDKARARMRVFIAAGVSSSAFIAVGLSGAGKDGLAWGLFNDSERTTYLDRQLQPVHGLAKGCGPATLKAALCQTGPDPVILVWGDSFAQHIVPAVLTATSGRLPIAQLTLPRCGPFADTAPYTTDLGLAWSRSCASFNNDVLEWLRASPSVQQVVLSSPFRAYVSEDWQVLHDGELKRSSVDLAVELFRATLEKIEAMGKTPIVVSPTPQSGRNIGRCLAMRAWTGSDPSRCDFELAEATDTTRTAMNFIDRIAMEHTVVRLPELICPDGICRTIRSGTFMYFDSAHLTDGGSRWVGQQLRARKLFPQ